MPATRPDALGPPQACICTCLFWSWNGRCMVCLSVPLDLYWPKGTLPSHPHSFLRIQHGGQRGIDETVLAAVWADRTKAACTMHGHHLTDWWPNRGDGRERGERRERREEKEHRQQPTPTHVQNRGGCSGRPVVGGKGCGSGKGERDKTKAWVLGASEERWPTVWKDTHRPERGPNRAGPEHCQKMPCVLKPQWTVGMAKIA